jgi:hypothetical protein
MLLIDFDDYDTGAACASVISCAVIATTRPATTARISSAALPDISPCITTVTTTTFFCRYT